MGSIVIDTLGKLREHGHGLFGYRQICRKAFGVDMAALIAQRGADYRYIRMPP